MVWRRIGNKPSSEPMLTQFTDAYMCVCELTESVNSVLFKSSNKNVHLKSKCWYSLYPTTRISHVRLISFYLVCENGTACDMRRTIFISTNKIVSFSESHFMFSPVQSRFNTVYYEKIYRKISQSACRRREIDVYNFSNALKLSRRFGRIGSAARKKGNCIHVPCVLIPWMLVRCYMR